MTKKQKYEMLQYWLTHLYNETESWNGRLGQDIAYLCHAVATDSSVAFSKHSNILKLMRSIDTKMETNIWRFIETDED